LEKRNPLRDEIQAIIDSRFGNNRCRPKVMDENAFTKKAEVKAPQDAFVTQTIKANVNGEFAYSIPREGWWGFCALGSGPETEHKGKELSQDAVIWVQARDME
jgi:cobalt/nickel transport protein